MTNDPLFQVILPTSTPEERRLVSVEQARLIIGSPEADDGLLAFYLDAVSAAAATFCNLARDGSLPVTFGRERFRATWANWSCGHKARLMLPWRVPITSISIVEDGATLLDADFRHIGSGILERLVDGNTVDWWAGNAVVEYEAGWLLAADASAYDGVTDAPPADLVSLVIDQVRMQYKARKKDPNLRSEDIAGIGSWSFNVVGGDTIGPSGLLRSLETALTSSGFRKMAFA